MKTEEILQHLGDLKTEAEGHFTDDGDDEIFHQDAEALQAAAEERRMNYGDRRTMLMELLRTIKGGEE